MLNKETVEIAGKHVGELTGVGIAFRTHGAISELITNPVPFSNERFPDDIGQLPDYTNTKMHDNLIDKSSKELGGILASTLKLISSEVNPEIKNLKEIVLSKLDKYKVESYEKQIKYNFIPKLLEDNYIDPKVIPDAPTNYPQDYALDGFTINSDFISEALYTGTPVDDLFREVLVNIGNMEDVVSMVNSIFATPNIATNKILEDDDVYRRLRKAIACYGIFGALASKTPSGTTSFGSETWINFCKVSSKIFGSILKNTVTEISLMLSQHVLIINVVDNVIHVNNAVVEDMDIEDLDSIIKGYTIDASKPFNISRSELEQDASMYINIYNNYQVLEEERMTREFNKIHKVIITNTLKSDAEITEIEKSKYGVDGSPDRDNIVDKYLSGVRSDDYITKLERVLIVAVCKSRFGFMPAETFLLSFRQAELKYPDMEDIGLATIASIDMLAEYCVSGISVQRYVV